MDLLSTRSPSAKTLLEDMGITDKHVIGVSFELDADKNDGLAVLTVKRYVEDKYVKPISIALQKYNLIENKGE